MVEFVRDLARTFPHAPLVAIAHEAGALSRRAWPSLSHVDVILLKSARASLDMIFVSSSWLCFRRSLTQAAVRASSQFP